MARTNIEEEAHRRVAKLAGLMSCSDREALGTVGYLWTDSQDILATHGAREQVLEWAHLFNLSDEKSNEWISALEKSRFISCTESGQYKIHGNEIQIESRVKFTARATKGGNALKKKWNAKKRLKAGLKQALSTHQAGDKDASSSPMQCNSMQGNAKQSNALGLPPAKTPDPELNSLIWSSYAKAYESRYKTKPVRNAKVNGQVAQLAKRLGSEAPLVAEFYVGHSKSFYIGKVHEFGLLLSDAEALRTQWATGQKVTQRQAQQSDDRAAVNDQLTRIREGKL